MITTKEQFIQAFEANRPALQIQDPVLDELRETAMARFAELGIPTRKHEQWKYTDVAPVLNHGFNQHYSPNGSTVTSDTLNRFRIPGLDADVLVFVNGHFAKHLSTRNPVPDGVVVTNMASAFKHHRDQISAHYGSYANVQTEPFVALNTAFAQDGAYVYVPAETTLARPVHVMHITDAAENLLVQPRHLFVVENGGTATFVESYHAFGASKRLNNIVTEIFVAERATVDHYRMQNEGEDASQICATNAYQQAETSFSTVTLTLNGELIRNNLHSHPDAEHCETYLSGLYLMRDHQHVDNSTFVDHAKPYCHSSELYKGILDDHASSAFSGMLLVRPHAQKTNAFQENKTILLTDDASSYAKPQLEIYADDVRCSHGATTGAVDNEALFYLRARGIGEEEARNLLLFAFVNDVIERIQLEPLRDQLLTMLEERLN